MTVAAMAVPLDRKGPYYFVSDVFVEGHGPFRFLLDTGAQSSAVSERVAALAGLTPSFRVEQVTASGSRHTAATHARLVVGRTEAPHVEVLIGGFAAKADGVLGQSFLRQFDYLLDEHVLTFDPEPLTGHRLALLEFDGRPAVTVCVDGGQRNVVLDSGSPAVVLYGGARSGIVRTVSTNAGSALGFERAVQIRAGSTIRLLPSIALPGRRDQPGLLPTAAFRAVYVNNRARYVVLK